MCVSIGQKFKSEFPEQGESYTFKIIDIKEKGELANKFNVCTIEIIDDVDTSCIGQIHTWLEEDIVNCTFTKEVEE